jgi:hypothetical protein
MPNFKPKPYVLAGYKVLFEDVFHAQEELTAPEWVLEAMAEGRINQKRSLPGMTVSTEDGDVDVPLGHWIMQRADETLFTLTPERLAAEYDLA